MDDIVVADITNLPSLFGVSIYSFMCHHSLPSLLTPMSRKSTLNSVLVFDFALILGFYCLLCFTATFRFDGEQCDRACSGRFLTGFASSHPGRPLHPQLQTLQVRFCVLLPRSLPCLYTKVGGMAMLLLTIVDACVRSANFPIIAITLRNNLKLLLSSPSRKMAPWVEKVPCHVDGHSPF